MLFKYVLPFTFPPRLQEGLKAFYDGDVKHQDMSTERTPEISALLNLRLQYQLIWFISQTRA